LRSHRDQRPQLPAQEPPRRRGSRSRRHRLITMPPPSRPPAHADLPADRPDPDDLATLAQLLTQIDEYLRSGAVRVRGTARHRPRRRRPRLPPSRPPGSLPLHGPERHRSSPPTTSSTSSASPRSNYATRPEPCDTALPPLHVYPYLALHAR
jgi:hypothetical protein